jgi:hypothetical protein
MAGCIAIETRDMCLRMIVLFIVDFLGYSRSGGLLQLKKGNSQFV